MHVHLEPLGREHLEFVRGLRNSLRQYFFDTKPITKLEQKAWYLRYLVDHKKLFWIIQVNSNRKNVGTLSTNIIIEPVLNMAVVEIGNLMLLPQYVGRGVMSDAFRDLNTMISHCFWVAHVKPHNTASLRLFKRAGFWRVPRAR